MASGSEMAALMALAQARKENLSSVKESGLWLTMRF
jgi:hypothetical protein